MLAERDHTGNTALNRAIAAGRIAQILTEFLVRENLLRENDDSENAFHLAAASGHFETIPEELCEPDDCVMLLGNNNQNLIIYAHEHDHYHLNARTLFLLRQYPTWDPRARALSQVIMAGSLHLIPITSELAKRIREVSLAVQTVWDQTGSEIKSKASMEQSPEKIARILECKSYSRTWLTKLTKLALSAPVKTRIP